MPKYLCHIDLYDESTQSWFKKGLCYDSNVIDSSIPNENIKAKHFQMLNPTKLSDKELKELKASKIKLVNSKTTVYK